MCPLFSREKMTSLVLRKIYREKLADGTLVVIRSLNMREKHSPQAYTPQIEMISKLRHKHLVSALGHYFQCCLDDSSVSIIYLVFEFVPNGTLRGCICSKVLCYCIFNINYSTMR